MSNNTGNNIRLVRVAINKVTEVNHPKDWVPPNPLKQNMINPAINTIAVYNMLNPVCLIVAETVAATL